MDIGSDGGRYFDHTSPIPSDHFQLYVKNNVMISQKWKMTLSLHITIAKETDLRLAIPDSQYYD